MAAFVMFILGLLLFWLPVLGPLFAGFIGGRMAGGAGEAILAALLPALLVALLVLLVSITVALPLLGLTVASVVFVGMALSSIPMLVGAVVGGLTA